MSVRIMAGLVIASDPFGSALGTARGALAQACEQPMWSVTDAELPGLIRAVCHPTRLDRPQTPTPPQHLLAAGLATQTPALKQGTPQTASILPPSFWS